MKPRPRADYTVRALWESVDRGTEHGPSCEGIYRVILDSSVRIFFVPEVDHPARDWSDRLFPARVAADHDLVTTPQEARVVTALMYRYVVTPSTGFQGAQKYHRLHDEHGAPTGLAFNVSPGAFERYSVELEHLAENLSPLGDDWTVDEIRDRSVIEFLECTVIPSPSSICRTQPSLAGGVRDEIDPESATRSLWQ